MTPTNARMGASVRRFVPLALWSALVCVLGLGPARAAPADGAGAGDGAVPPAVVDLDTLLRRIRSDNPAVRIAQARLADNQADFDRAYYAWTPQLRIESLLAPLPERRLLKLCVLSAASYAVAGGADLDQVGPCPGQNIQRDARLTSDTEIGILVRTTARVSFPIYTFGKIEAGQQAARAGLEVGRAGLELTRAELELMVKQAYFGAQLAHSIMAVLDDGRSRIRAAKQDIESELARQSGRFTSNDLRMLIVQQADLEAGYLETEALSQTAWEGLRIAAGLEAGHPIRLDRYTLKPVRVEPRTREAYLELAMLSRPDLRLADAGVRARASLVALEEAGFFPDIALVGQFTYAKGTSADFNPDPFSNDQFNQLGWGVVLGAEWRLDFANQLAKVRKAQAKLVETRAQRDALIQKVRLDMSDRVGQVSRYRQEVEVRLSAMKAGKGWLVSNTLNFGLGLASTDDLIRALTAYSKAQMSYFRAIYEYNLAVARLSQGVGTELAVPTPDDEPDEPPSADDGLDDAPAEKR